MLSYKKVIEMFEIYLVKERLLWTLGSYCLVEIIALFHIPK